MSDQIDEPVVVGVVEEPDSDEEEEAATSVEESSSTSKGELVAVNEPHVAQKRLSLNRHSARSVKTVKTTTTTTKKSVEFQAYKDLEQKYHDAHGEIEAWKAKYNDTLQQMDALDKNLTQQLQNKSHHIEQLEQQLHDQGKADIVKDVKQVKELQRQNLDLDREKSMLERQVKSLQSKLETSTSKLTRHQNRSKEIEQDLRNRIETLESQLRETDLKHARVIDQQTSSIQIALQQQTEANETLQKSYDDLTRKLELAHKQLEEEKGKGKTLRLEWEERLESQRREMMEQLKLTMTQQNEGCSCETVIQRLITVIKNSSQSMTSITQNLESIDIVRCQKETETQLEIISRIRKQLEDAHLVLEGGTTPRSQQALNA